MAVTHAVEIGARVITISSTGNHGASTAAYAARAGLPCVIFTLASVPDTMKTLMQAYGAAVVACPTSESRWDAHARGRRAASAGIRPAASSRRPSARTRGASRATRRSPTRSPRTSAGRRPTSSSCRARTATGSTGSGRAGRSCRRSASSRPPPRMIAAEPFGPLAHALERELEAPEIVDAPAPSVAFSIASRYGTWQGLAALRESGGAGVRRDRRGDLRGPARARARGRPLRRAVLGGGDDGRHAARRRRKALDPAQTIVVVLTSGGLKDPGRQPHVAARRCRPPTATSIASSPRCARPMDWRWTDSLGVALLGPRAARPPRCEWARAAERAGLGSLWVIEDYFHPGAYALGAARPRPPPSGSRSASAW